MATPRIVLDTNILISAQRSRRGASGKLLSLVGTGRFEIYLSVALALEYEDVLMRKRSELGLMQDDVADLVDALCALSNHQKIYYLWRPYLRDPSDEFVLDLMVAAGCAYIITFNQRHFAGVERFGIQLMAPGEFLSVIGETA